MSSIVNALFGRDHKEDHTTHGSASVSTSGSTHHTAVSDDVRVKSVVSTDTKSNVNMQHTQKITDLMAKLGSTHSQIDEYSKKRQEQISDAVAESIKKVVLETQQEQERLLQDANIRSHTIEQEYTTKLQAMVEQLDATKASTLAALERELNERQEAILASARKRIDDLNEHANALKMGVLKDAQAKAQEKITTITDEVKNLTAADAQNRLQSTTTTVIQTQAKSAGETHVAGMTTVGGETTTTTTNKSSAQHYESHKKH